MPSPRSKSVDGEIVTTARLPRAALHLVSLALIVGAVLHPQAVAADEDPRRKVVDYNAETGELIYVVYEAGERQTVDVSDMTVDLECAERYFYSPFQSLRLRLLESGCARLLAGAGSVEEREAERRANPPSSTPPATTSATKAAPDPDSSGAPDEGGWSDALSSTLLSTRDWVAKYWWAAVSFLIAVLSLVWVSWVIYHRRVVIVLIGAAGAGKTELWRALKDGRAPDLDAQPTMGRTKPVGLEPIEHGKYVLFPAVADAAGAEQWHVLNEMARARSRFLRWKRKLVLLVVAAPTRNFRADSGSGSAVNDAFVSEQKGYMSLPRAIIGRDRRRERPHLVLLFISKFDLFSQSAPGDPPGDSARARINDLFLVHKEQLESICLQRDIPFHAIIGSAKFGWGVDDVKKNLSRALKA